MAFTMFCCLCVFFALLYSLKKNTHTVTAKSAFSFVLFLVMCACISECLLAFFFSFFLFLVIFAFLSDFLLAFFFSFFFFFFFLLLLLPSDYEFLPLLFSYRA